MDLSLLALPVAALGRAVFGWLENSFADGKITALEWKKLLETVVRMGAPMAALVFGLNADPVITAGLVTFADWGLIKVVNALKRK